jgi:NAD(P)-dependent dehydrogenase (short-subunit alcohol dehydrogenase family)
MNIVISGCSRGIGYHTALHLCRSGHHVVAFARDGKGLEKLESEARKGGFADHLYVTSVDITNEADVLRLKHQVNEMHAQVDVLINNAGAFQKKPFSDFTSADWRSIYEVNVFSVFRLTQLMLPLMGKNRLGHILNISSMGGVQGSVKFPGLTVYSSSKAALAGFTEVLAVELEQKNIHVNCLALGSARTEMLLSAFPEYTGGADPDRLGKWIAEFAVSGSEFFNGKIIPVSSSTP